jgi:hypothetical protein
VKTEADRRTTKEKTMNALAKIASQTLRMLLRAALLAMLVSAPMLVANQLEAGQQNVIEAPALKKMGAGLVILVSLQRA